MDVDELTRVQRRRERQGDTQDLSHLGQPAAERRRMPREPGGPWMLSFKERSLVGTVIGIRY